MKKIAVFVEGQGELIFVRKLLFCFFSPDKLSFECFRLKAQNQEEVPYTYGNKDTAEVYFQIMDTQGDGSVLPAIKKREKRLFDAGFTKIIGLRDIYSQAYCKLSPNVIDDQIIQEFVAGTTKTVSTMSQPKNIYFHFAIMELEAWWFCLYPLFEKINSQLTVAFIHQKLGYDLSAVDPERTFFHPATKFKGILESVQLTYDKHNAEVEKIVSPLTRDCDSIVDIILEENQRCQSFKRFCNDLMG